MSRVAESDPTVQAPFAPAACETGLWAVSLSEIEAMCRKAARGAGMTWGLADEAGRAARVLAALELDGPGALLAALDATDGRICDHAPRPGPPCWGSAAGALCPVATGAALSDRAEALSRGPPVRLGPVLSPIMLVPFLWTAACALRTGFRIEGPGIALVATPAGPGGTGWDRLAAPVLGGLSVAHDTPAACAAPRAKGRGPLPVPVALWRQLDAYAYRTYAPATESSRLSGAGASLMDTD